MQVWFRSTFTVCSWDLWECGWGGKKGTNLANEKSEVSQELLLMFSWRLYDEWLTSWPLRPPFFFVMRHFCICRMIQKLHDQHQHGEHMDKNNNARLAWMDPFININQCTGPTGEVLDFSIAFFCQKCDNNNQMTYIWGLWGTWGSSSCSGCGTRKWFEEVCCSGTTSKRRWTWNRCYNKDTKKQQSEK